MKTPYSLRRERGSRIRIYREAQGETQAELAKVIGVHRETMCDIEAGRRDLSLLEGALLARHFRIGTDFLIGEGPHFYIAK